MQASMEGLKSNALDREPMQTQVRDDIANWLRSTVGVRAAGRRPASRRGRRRSVYCRARQNAAGRS